MTSTHDPRPQARRRTPAELRVLMLPASQGAAAVVVWLANRSAHISDAIGGGNLDEALHAPPAPTGDGWCV